MTGPLPDYLCTCVTCSDQGVEMTVVECDPGGLARCRAQAGGDDTVVDVELVAPVAPGDLVLVHAGVALALLAKGAAA